MAQSLAQIYVHLVFSTKNRAPFLKAKGLREEMHAYLGGACKNLGSPALKVGGTENHVHLLCRLSRSSSIADLLKKIKQNSSKWVKGKDSSLSDFRWQDGYGAFSISPAHVPALCEYISNQEEHHKKEHFEDEFRRLLKKYGIDYDEQYVWG